MTSSERPVSAPRSRAPVTGLSLEQLSAPSSQVLGAIPWSGPTLDPKVLAASSFLQALRR